MRARVGNSLFLLAGMDMDRRAFVAVLAGIFLMALAFWLSPSESELQGPVGFEPVRKPSSWLERIPQADAHPPLQDLMDLLMQRPSGAPQAGLTSLFGHFKPSLEQMNADDLRLLMREYNAPGLEMAFLEIGWQLFQIQPSQAILAELIKAAEQANAGAWMYRLRFLEYLNEASLERLTRLLQLDSLKPMHRLWLILDQFLLQGGEREARALLSALKNEEPALMTRVLRIANAHIKRSLGLGTDSDPRASWVRTVRFDYPLALAPRQIRADCQSKTPYCFAGGINHLRYPDWLHLRLLISGQWDPLLLEDLRKMDPEALSDDAIAYVLQNSAIRLSHLPFAYEAFSRNPPLQGARRYTELIAKEGRLDSLPLQIRQPLQVNAARNPSNPKSQKILLNSLKQDVLSTDVAVTAALMAHAKADPQADQYTRFALQKSSDRRLQYFAANSILQESKKKQAALQEVCRFLKPKTEREWDMVLDACERVENWQQYTKLQGRKVHQSGRDPAILATWHQSLLSHSMTDAITAELEVLDAVEVQSLSQIRRFHDYGLQNNLNGIVQKSRELGLAFTLIQGQSNLPSWLRKEEQKTQVRQEVAAIVEQEEPLQEWPVWIGNDPSELPVVESAPALAIRSLPSLIEPHAAIPKASVAGPSPYWTYVVEGQSADQSGMFHAAFLVDSGVSDFQVGLGYFGVSSQHEAYARIRAANGWDVALGNEYRQITMGNKVRLEYREQPFFGAAIAATENLNVEELAVALNRRLQKQYEVRVRYVRRKILDSLGQELETADGLRIVLEGQKERLLYGAAYQKNDAREVFPGRTRLPLGSFERSDVYLGVALGVFQGSLRVLLGQSRSASNWHDFQRLEFESKGGLSLYYESSYEPRLAQDTEEFGFRLQKGF